jgi:hypothetical protein
MVYPFPGNLQCYFVTDGGNLPNHYSVEMSDTSISNNSAGKKLYLNWEEQEKEQLKSKLKIPNNTAKSQSQSKKSQQRTRREHWSD